MTAKAKGHEDLAATHKGLEEAAAAIVVKKKAEDKKNVARTEVLIADCKKQMADNMAAMQASSKAAREKAQAAIMKKMAEKQVVERTEQLKEANEEKVVQEADLSKWKKKKDVTVSPKGKADMQTLIDETLALLKQAIDLVATRQKKLSAAKLQIQTGDYTELSHLKMKATEELNKEVEADGRAGNECIDFVQAKEDTRHKILLDEWTRQEGIEAHNLKIKTAELLAGVNSRNTEQERSNGYDAARKSANAVRAAADEALAAYEKIQSSGKCCAFLQMSGQGANPHVMKEECCNAHGCTYDESKTVTSHLECSTNGQLTKTGGCVCRQGWGGTDCSVKVSKQGCYSGAGGDNVSCASCYSCGDEKRNKDGSIQVAAAGFCTNNGKDLCLSCPKGSGLIRYGDSNAGATASGYKQAGRCQPYPIADAGKASHDAPDPANCKEVCAPEKNVDFKGGSVMTCTKVCSSWNPVVVDKTGKQVEATALCHVRKDAHCHPNISGGTTMHNIQTKDHTCVSKKEVSPAAICYSLSEINGKKFTGVGTSCEGAGVSTVGAVLKDLLSNHSAGAQWCCYKDHASLPAWMKAVSKHQWCSATAMRA